MLGSFIKDVDRKLRLYKNWRWTPYLASLEAQPIDLVYMTLSGFKSSDLYDTVLISLRIDDVSTRISLIDG